MVYTDWLSDDEPVDVSEFVFLQERLDASISEKKSPWDLDTSQSAGLAEKEVKGGGDGLVVDGWEVLHQVEIDHAQSPEHLLVLLLRVTQYDLRLSLLLAEKSRNILKV